MFTLFERSSAAGTWEKQLETTGHLGMNGMSNHRHSGDKTTPIGVFKMNTPLRSGQSPGGFPSDYIQVDDTYVWEDDTNKMSRDLSKEGEQVGSSGYAGYYDYAIDAGFNQAALKIRVPRCSCTAPVSLRITPPAVGHREDQMAQIMKLYGKYGSGAVVYRAGAEGNI